MATNMYETPLLIDVEEAAGSCGLCTTGGSAVAMEDAP